MSNNNSSVGSNAGKTPAVSQCCTPFSIDLCAVDADTVYDPAAILALLIAQGATHNNVTNDPFAETDFIHDVDADLKPVDGEGQCFAEGAFTTEVATECDAIYGVNGGQSNLDPGGSRENDGGAKNTGAVEAGYSLPNKFDFVEVKQGSIVTLSGVVCQDVPGITSAEEKKEG